MRRLKLTLGVLMIAALFVPLSECSHGKKPDAPPPPKPLAQKIFPRSDAHTDYDYGALRLAPSLNGAITAIAFAWPATFALCNRLVAGKRYAWIFFALELLLGAATIYWVYAVTEAGTRLWGAYFVFALTVAYTIAALMDFAASCQTKVFQMGGA
ncbi:MAG: hypothetical protein M3429_10150 [Verrucomicrobiota bacterium]|nr:hypothetical protein [Verrucomicrobiota bacterium]